MGSNNFSVSLQPLVARRNWLAQAPASLPASNPATKPADSEATHLKELDKIRVIDLLAKTEGIEKILLLLELYEKYFALLNTENIDKIKNDFPIYFRSNYRDFIKQIVILYTSVNSKTEPQQKEAFIARYGKAYGVSYLNAAKEFVDKFNNPHQIMAIIDNYNAAQSRPDSYTPQQKKSIESEFEKLLKKFPLYLNGQARAYAFGAAFAEASVNLFRQFTEAANTKNPADRGTGRNSINNIANISQDLLNLLKVADYTEAEFRVNKTISALIAAIRADNYDLGFNLGNTVSDLNFLLRKPDFYNVWLVKKGSSFNLPKKYPKILQLVKETENYRTKKYEELTLQQKLKIISLNRQLIGITYPKLSPYLGFKNHHFAYFMRRGWPVVDNGAVNISVFTSRFRSDRHKIFKALIDKKILIAKQGDMAMVNPEFMQRADEFVRSFKVNRVNLNDADKNFIYSKLRINPNRIFYRVHPRLGLVAFTKMNGLYAEPVALGLIRDSLSPLLPKLNHYHGRLYPEIGKPGSLVEAMRNAITLDLKRLLSVMQEEISRGRVPQSAIQKYEAVLKFVQQSKHIESKDRQAFLRKEATKSQNIGLLEEFRKALLDWQIQIQRRNVADSLVPKLTPPASRRTKPPASKPTSNFWQKHARTGFDVSVRMNPLDAAIQGPDFAGRLAKQYDPTVGALQLYVYGGLRGAGIKQIWFDGDLFAKGGFSATIPNALASNFTAGLKDVVLGLINREGFHFGPAGDFALGTITTTFPNLTNPETPLFYGGRVGGFIGGNWKSVGFRLFCGYEFQRAEVKNRSYLTMFSPYEKNGFVADARFRFGQFLNIYATYRRGSESVDWQVPNYDGYDPIKMAGDYTFFEFGANLTLAKFEAQAWFRHSVAGSPFGPTNTEKDPSIPQPPFLLEAGVSGVGNLVAGLWIGGGVEAVNPDRYSHNLNIVLSVLLQYRFSKELKLSFTNRCRWQRYLMTSESIRGEDFGNKIPVWESVVGLGGNWGPR